MNITNSISMASIASAALALPVLHYIAPVATATYFISAKTAATCLLQEPSKRGKLSLRRYGSSALQLTILATVVAEAVTTITQAFQDSTFAPAQDYVIYLFASFVLHGCFSLGLIENEHPLWHPYLGAWLIALAFDFPLIVLQGLRIPEDGYAKGRMSICVLRSAALVALSILASWCILSDRKRSIRLDDESEALLAANGHEASTNGTRTKPITSPRDSVLASENGDTGDDNEERDDGFDSDSEEPEEDKKLRAQQKQRLQESGSWFAYLKEFNIFIPMLLPRKNRLVQACLVTIGVCIFMNRALNILVPRQVGIVVNELTEAYGTGVVPWRALGLWMLYTSLSSGVGIGLLKALAEMPVNQYGHRMIATTAFQHIMDLDMHFHNEKNSGELIRVIDQGSTLQDLLSYMLFDIGPMFFDLAVAFVYVSILFDVYMSVIMFAIGISYVWIGAKVTAWSIKQRRDFNSAWLNESRVQNEAINNWSTVSHFNRGKYESIRYDESVVAFNLAEWRYYLAYYLGGGFQSGIMLIGRLAAMSLAAYRVSQGSAPVGNFVTLSMYWSSVEAPLRSVSYSIRKITSMLTDSERLLQLLTTKPLVNEQPEAKDIEIKEGTVTFENVDFSYDPRKSTLRNINLEIKAGQTIALVGETGGGKSTILKLLYRYYDVTNGAIRIDGQDIRHVTLDSLRDSFGMVPQDPALFNTSIMENIKYARLDATDEEVKEACRAAAIHDKIESFPDGYKAKVGERGVKLSGGELQRVAIARAILRQPKIVLLDEATSMIDAETEATIQLAFKRLSASRTTFVVAHRLSTIQHADQILVIHDGEIVEHGTHAELFRQKGKYVALWSKQLNKDVQDVGTSLDVQKADEVLKTDGSGEAQVRVQDVMDASSSSKAGSSSEGE
ncbi:Heavy metal tolerance protein [Fulvia fulva]|uniref:Heavy metal tolerance protein n=1 Tax=Passalora fulva TaxID=5499 RepID=A0A9Q8URM4_PASFU|nr:Heavy metal tolerance protein [Fulvia fulva]KAK4619468.1 Heavy metal tolerance protein [Fulvia fulva]KAK4620707.1 Heavy metal tolerance protein [Fulvia fulva]UJO19872.1 Heavy metal tolerance protein [Fulvia fulva]WPV17658.1 Heavy metal tolerance protein [Fulvia fulva]WPV32480.1 Heavy metal tolerance protein [Fulvia fulva]